MEKKSVLKNLIFLFSCQGAFLLGCLFVANPMTNISPSDLDVGLGFDKI